MAGASLRMLKRVSRAKLAEEAVRTEVWRAITDTAIAIENDVKGGPNAAPYVSGNLRASYHIRLFPERLYAEVGADPRIAPYAPHVEYGTKRSTARPHLRPAALAQRETFRQRIAAAMKRATKRLP